MMDKCIIIKAKRISTVYVWHMRKIHLIVSFRLVTSNPMLSKSCE